MKSLVPRIAEAILALATICLLVALLIPWRDPIPKGASNKTAAALPSDPTFTANPPERAAPETILALFVRRAPRTISGRVAAPAAKKPVDAPWLNFLGFYSGAPGKPYYLLKDTRSGRVIMVSQSTATKGWSLVEVADKSLIVRYNDDSYIVAKR